MKIKQLQESVKTLGRKGKHLTEAEEILYVIKDSHGNQLSRPNPDDDELWDRVASMEARGRRGLCVVVYTGKKECLSEADDTQYGVHSFSQDAIIFRGTEEECGRYIDSHKELWDDAEVYKMELGDPHYKKMNESIEVATIADYITDHYEFDDIDDKYECINSIRDSFKDEKTISQEELEQFIGAHNGRDKVEEALTEDKGQPRSKRYTTYFNRIKKAIEKGDEETLQRTKEAIMYAPAKELKNSEAAELMDMIKNRKINEAFDVDKVAKRIARHNEFDNGYVLHNYERMTSAEAEEKARLASIESPDDIFYVSYDNIMEPCSDIKWKNGKKLSEASYGGAFDIADDQYFTRDDLNSFADEVLGHVSETFNGSYDIGGVWFEDGNVITQIVAADGSEFEDKTKVDMRRIREPWHLKRMYAFPVAANIIKQIEENNADVVTENIQGMGEYSDKFYAYLEFLQNEGKQDNIAYLASQLIRYCKDEDLKDLWFDRMHKVAQSVGFETGESIEEGIVDEFHTAQRYLDTEIPDICRSAADQLPNMTEDTMKHLNYQCRKFYAIVEDALVAKTNESLTEDVTDAQQLETGASIGMAAVVSDLIKDEYEAIDGYNSAIATAEAEGFEDAVKVLTDIQAEENLHVGQLQELMKMFDANADKVDEGQAEAEEQINNSAETPNNNIEESADMKKERWEEIYDSFKTVEKELNQDGEAVTAVVDQMYRDNKDDPDYKKAYDKWASNE